MFHDESYRICVIVFSLTTLMLCSNLDVGFSETPRRVPFQMSKMADFVRLKNQESVLRKICYLAAVIMLRVFSLTSTCPLSLKSIER